MTPCDCSGSSQGGATWWSRLATSCRQRVFTMFESIAGPVILYVTVVNLLMMQFFVFPAMLLSGRREEEDILRRANLISLCVVVVLDLLWTNLHPRPVSLRLVALAAGAAAVAQAIHLALALGLIDGVVYSPGVARVLHIFAALAWVLVSQVGSAYVVSSGRSPARFQILAWITIMTLGTVITIFPTLRQMPWLVLGVAVLPRVAVAVVVGIASSTAAVSLGAGATAADADDFTVSFARAAQFAIFACNGTTGEALNDMATDLKVRSALSEGDTKLTLAYNCAVLLSMCGGFFSETNISEDATRRWFAGLWGFCQFCRGFGMQYLTGDRLWLMFAFVFLDKFSGPLGQAALDTALLSLLRPRVAKEAGSNSSVRVPANAMWTLRSAAERMERPASQLALLHLQAANAPAWLPMVFASVTVFFVMITLRPSSDKTAKVE